MPRITELQASLNQLRALRDELHREGDQAKEGMPIRNLRRVVTRRY